MLIRFAYTLGDYQILNAPGWTESEGYDILAKPAPRPEPDPWASEEGQRRLRESTKALLAERFGFQAHIETRESPIYALVVAKGGPKLKPSVEKQMQITTNNTNVICTRATMARFAAIVLSARMGRLRRVLTLGRRGPSDCPLHILQPFPLTVSRRRQQSSSSPPIRSSKSQQRV
jgi:uncharacterized protein (TIGR03435 family)